MKKNVPTIILLFLCLFLLMLVVSKESINFASPAHGIGLRQEGFLSRYSGESYMIFWGVDGDIWSANNDASFPWTYQGNILSELGLSGQIITATDWDALTSEGELIGYNPFTDNMRHKGNIFEGGTATTETTWSELKAEY